ncbi:MAG: TlpA disulfide reductase family protein, partial [Myxococcota bacterium]
MVAVEFFATWCKPCMDAVPRWRALHEKYQSEGLRFIVVSTQDPDGSCNNPGWTPDAVICDDDGFLARRFGANKLPAAFLWNWQGRLLAQMTHVDEVENRIQSWMRRSPRVDVKVGRVVDKARVGRRELLNLVRGELKDVGKLVVVATADERRALRRIVRRSLAPTANESLACEVGAEVTANSLVQVSITGERIRRLQLRLLSAERGCLVASARVRWRSDRPTASVSEAVSKLVGRLRLSPTQYPWSSAIRRNSPAASSPLPQSSSPGDYQSLLAKAEAEEQRARKAEQDARLA